MLLPSVRVSLRHRCGCCQGLNQDRERRHARRTTLLKLDLPFGTAAMPWLFDCCKRPLHNSKPLLIGTITSSQCQPRRQARCFSTPSKPVVRKTRRSHSQEVNASPTPLCVFVLQSSPLNHSKQTPNAKQMFTSTRAPYLAGLPPLALMPSATHHPQTDAPLLLSPASPSPSPYCHCRRCRSCCSCLRPPVRLISLLRPRLPHTTPHAAAAPPPQLQH